MSLLPRISSIVDAGYHQFTADRIFDWTLGSRLFELGDLNPHARPVAWFGYASLLTLLGSIFGLELVGGGGSAVGTSVPVAAPGDPMLVVLIACIGFVAAWALLMTGALYARRAVAILLLVVFGIQIIVVGARVVFASLVLTVLAACIQFLFRSKPSLREWKRTPTIVLLTWLLLLSALMALASMAGPRADTFASQLTSVMAMWSVCAIGLWFAMGCGAIVSAVRLSIALVGYLRRHIAPSKFATLGIVVACLLAPGEIVFGIVERDAPWIVGGALVLSLLPIIFILFLGRRWTSRHSAIIVGLGSTLFVFALSLSLAMHNSASIGRGVQATGIFPPLLLFLVLAVDHLLRFGKPIRRIAPRLGSQSAWVLIYLGIIVLVLSGMLFLMNHTSAITGRAGSDWPRALGGLTLAAMLISGPIYLTWVVLRRQVWWTGINET